MKPEIDYIYWRENYINDIESGNPKERTKKSLNNIRGQILNHLKESDELYHILIEENFEKRTMQIIEKFAFKIAEKINTSNNVEANDKYYLTIFDAINAWGGSAIRLFYNYQITIQVEDTKKIEGIPRSYYKYWLNHYIIAIAFIEKGDFDNALKEIVDNIPGIGVSFGTKHIWFWSEYFKSKNENDSYEVATVYDERMAKLFFGKSAKLIEYSEIRIIFKNIANELNSKYKDFLKFDSKDVERSIFAFSQFYFNNNLTNWGEEKYKQHPKKKESSELIESEINKYNAILNFEVRELLKNGVDYKFANKIYKLRNPIMYDLIEKVTSEEISVAKPIEYNIKSEEGKSYIIKYFLGIYKCNCESFRYRKKECKHILSLKNKC
jgi:hypothetical protein